MANFGMIDRSVAFNPISAFPLDARSYFESYAEALAAAQIASVVGDTNTQYYFGETIAVVENGAAQLYIIQPDKTLKEVGSKIIVDENVFDLDDEGKLNLVGFANAAAGAQLLKGSDGKLSWVKPDNTTVQGLQTTVAGLQKDIKDLQNALNPVDEEGNPTEGGLISDVDDLKESVGEEATYDEEGNELTPATGIYKDIEDIEDKIGSKAEHDEEGSLVAAATGLYAELEKKADKASVYTIEQADKKIADAIAAIDHLKRVIVDELPAVEEADVNTIYMMPSGLLEDANKYYEWILINGVFEKVGSWEVNLDDYALKTEVSDLADIVADNKEAAEKAIEDEQNRAEKAEKANADAIAAEQARAELAEKANTDAIAAEKERAELAEQGLADDLADMDDAKANKADVYTKEEVYTKSETVAEILAQIDKVNENVGESAGAVLSKLEAYQKVVNMEVWGDENGSGDENGNSRIDNLVAQVQTLVNTKPFISEVDSDFQVVEGKLILKELPISKIDGLQDMSDNISVVQEKVGSLEDILNGYVDEETQEEVPGLVAEVQAIKENYLTIVDFNAAVGDLESLLAETTTIVERLETIEEVLKWQEMPNPTT